MPDIRRRMLLDNGQAIDAYFGSFTLAQQNNANTGVSSVTIPNVSLSSLLGISLWCGRYNGSSGSTTQYVDTVAINPNIGLCTSIHYESNAAFTSATTYDVNVLKASSSNYIYKFGAYSKNTNGPVFAQIRLQNGSITITLPNWGSSSGYYTRFLATHGSGGTTNWYYCYW